jgi:hypothetical protein
VATYALDQRAAERLWWVSEEILAEPRRPNALAVVIAGVPNHLHITQRRDDMKHVRLGDLGGCMTSFPTGAGNTARGAGAGIDGCSVDTIRLRARAGSGTEGTT